MADADNLQRNLQRIRSMQRRRLEALRTKMLGDIERRAAAGASQGSDHLLTTMRHHLARIEGEIVELESIATPVSQTTDATITKR